MSMRVEHVTLILAQVSWWSHYTYFNLLHSWLWVEVEQLERLHNNLWKRHHDKVADNSPTGNVWWGTLPQQDVRDRGLQHRCMLSRWVLEPLIYPSLRQWTALWVTGASGVSALKVVAVDSKDEGKTFWWSPNATELRALWSSHKRRIALRKTVRKVR